MTLRERLVMARLSVVVCGASAVTNLYYLEEKDGVGVGTGYCMVGAGVSREHMFDVILFWLMCDTV